MCPGGLARRLRCFGSGSIPFDTHETPQRSIAQRPHKAALYGRCQGCMIDVISYTFGCVPASAACSFGACIAASCGLRAGQSRCVHAWYIRALYIRVPPVYCCNFGC